MGKIQADSLIESCMECLGWPYVSPGSNSARGIDCSGLFVKGFRDHGKEIAHGSNTIWRKYCAEKGEITEAGKLEAGMAVFKWNPNTPEKFSDGLGDFQHIGLVVSVRPLQIIHASSAAGCVTIDTKIGKWKYWAKLKDVEYGGNENMSGGLPAEPELAEAVNAEIAAGTLAGNGAGGQTAVVFATSGETVNLRAEGKKSAELVARIAIGEQVEILKRGTEWSRVRYGKYTGWMMNQFLNTAQDEEAESGGDETAGADGIALKISGAEAAAMLDLLDLAKDLDSVRDLLAEKVERG